MLKSDLKDGMVVEVRKGLKYVLLNNRLIRDTAWKSFDDYREDLTSFDSNFDIVKVWDIGCFITLNGIKEPQNSYLLWKRKEYFTLLEAKATGKEFKHKDVKQPYWTSSISLALQDLHNKVGIAYSQCDEEINKKVWEIKN